MLPAGTSMTLRFLGAGGAFSRRFGTTCSVLELPSGERWLVDCGRQAPDQLAAAGLSWHQIDGQLVTHVHGDHVFGLEEFAFRRYYESAAGVPAIRDGGPRPKLVAHTAVLAELWEALGPSLRYLPSPKGPTGGTLGDYFDVCPPSSFEAPRAGPWRHRETFDLATISVSAREAVHVPGKPATSLAIAVSSGESRRYMLWSGDSTVEAAFLCDAEPHATVIFHDCTFLEVPDQVHGVFSQLEALPEAVRRKIVLMHHEDDVDLHRERALAAGFRFALPGSVFDLVSGQVIA